MKVTEIHTAKIVRETEKAVLIETLVSWNMAKPHKKELWLPKSVVVKVKAEEDGIIIDYRFACSLGMKFAFKGMPMDFVNGCSYELN